MCSAYEWHPFLCCINISHWVLRGMVMVLELRAVWGMTVFMLTLGPVGGLFVQEGSKLEAWGLCIHSSTSQGHVRHRRKKKGCIALFCCMLPLPTTLASLAAVCQQGPIHWMVAWQLRPFSANQDRMQQEFSPWHIKGRNRVVLHFNWFRFSVILFKGRRDAGPCRGESEPADISQR